MILTGNFSETNNAVLKDFEDKKFKKRLSRKTNPEEAGNPEPLVVEKKPGIAQTYLSIGARTVCSSHNDAPKLDIISALLGGGTSSQLFIELREKNAFTYDVNSDLSTGVDFGISKLTAQ